MRKISAQPNIAPNFGHYNELRETHRYRFPGNFHIYKQNLWLIVTSLHKLCTRQESTSSPCGQSPTAVGKLLAVKHVQSLGIISCAAACFYLHMWVPRHPWEPDSQTRDNIFPGRPSPKASVNLKCSLMPSPTAHCKQSLVLLVVSLFRLVPSDRENGVVGVDGGVDSIMTRPIIQKWRDMGQTECLPCKRSRRSRQTIVNYHKQSKFSCAAACFKTPMCSLEKNGCCGMLRLHMLVFSQRNRLYMGKHVCAQCSNRLRCVETAHTTKFAQCLHNAHSVCKLNGLCTNCTHYPQPVHNV